MDVWKQISGLVTLWSKPTLGLTIPSEWEPQTLSWPKACIIVTPPIPSFPAPSLHVASPGPSHTSPPSPCSFSIMPAPGPLCLPCLQPETTFLKSPHYFLHFFKAFAQMSLSLWSLSWQTFKNYILDHCPRPLFSLSFSLGNFLHVYFHEDR